MIQSTLLNQIVKKHVIETVLGTLSLVSNTSFSNQDYAIYWVYSTLGLSDVLFDQIQSSEDMILVSESTLTIEGLQATSITPTAEGHNLISISYSDFNVSDIHYHNSSLELMIVIFSTGSIQTINSSNISQLADDTITLNYLFSFRSTTLENFNSLVFTDISLSSSRLIRVISSNLTSAMNHSFSNTNCVIYTLEDSNIYGESITVENSTSAFDVSSSNMTLTFSNFSYLNSTKSALYLQSSNTIVNSTTFNSNVATRGAAISFLWDQGQSWNSSVHHCNFTNNNAEIEGGAIYYDLERPQMVENYFDNNTAQYGPNIASIPFKIVEEASYQDIIYLNNIPSGEAYNSSIQLLLVDREGQIMNLENDVAVKVSTSISDSRVLGVDSAVFISGTAQINGIIFQHYPGAVETQFNLRLTNSKTSIDSTPMYVSFRYCEPGEVEINNQCSAWSFGTYSFNWNATQWQAWMDHADWLGDTQISVESGYWRRTTNSSKIVKWLRSDACLGGYHPENYYPVQCEAGYSGVLWTSWEIVDGNKYQLLANFVCSKCPHPVLNALRVIGLSILVLMFLSLVIIVNIRKKSENQFSILLRIFTNYLHMISLAMSFGAEIPSTFTSVFTQFDKVGSPNETLFSFDWFIEDYDIRAFSPSNLLFKSFLLALWPLMLITWVFVILLILKCIVYWINHRFNYDLSRYMVISTIWIIFLFHPSLTLESLRLFQWIQIDDDMFRMRQHMDYECYSKDHLNWAFLIGLPILVLWVIGMPIIALITLIAYRKKLETVFIKKYLLLLYQGLRPNAFYWEFVNTFRKFIVLWCIVFL